MLIIKKGSNGIRVGAIKGYKISHSLHPNLYIQRIALDWR
ncbi:hypothetical protein HMPREF0305_11761 [Corynebacterium pseudogenitalium ATCC 33035]|uniref:Uncharacterized protein n=1 Tax=Corynebacterium pseudogenitalium ATCC 33035 TaxID=525264 RepID=E2S5M0_9CORY|nr:hypothetical protein HMPREF0305_11761 [Corynebacterium pseudogenitalium ATCC 33035]